MNLLRGLAANVLIVGLAFICVGIDKWAFLYER